MQKTTHAMLSQRLAFLNKSLSSNLTFQLSMANGGAQLQLHDKDGSRQTYGGYDSAKILEVRISGLSDMNDALFRSRCIPEEVEHLMSAFRDRIEGGTETLDIEISLLSNLSGALMAMTTVDKAKEAIAQVISQGVEQGILE